MSKLSEWEYIQDLQHDQEITRTHYEQEQDEAIMDAISEVEIVWEGTHADRFDRLMATRAAAQVVIDACNCGLMDKYSRHPAADDK